MNLLINQITSWIKETTSGFNGCVLGLSGGLDSALVATLCARAGIKTHVLIMPANYSSKANLDDAISLIKELNLEHRIINISSIIKAFAKQLGFKDAVDLANASPIRYGNLCARARMMLLYDYSAEHNLLVAGTSNKSERMLGYFTLWGDMACGFNPIAEFYKSELKELAYILKLPNNLITKKPSADFYDGQSDEEDLGFSYEIIDEQLKRIENGLDVDNKYQSIADRVNKNSFKLEPIKCFKRT